MAQPVFTGTGTKSSFEAFLLQFKIVAAINKWQEQDLGLILGAYLDGPALAYFKFIYKDGLSFKEICDGLKKEFSVGIDFVEKFYNARQDRQEEVDAFFFRLSEYAQQAGITDEKNFIKMFLKGVNNYYKYKLGTKLYSSRTELHDTLVQMKEIFGGVQSERMNLPVQPPRVRFETPSSNNQRSPISGRPASPGPTTSSATPHREGDGESFHTPRYDFRPRQRFENRTNRSRIAPRYRSPLPTDHPNEPGHSQ